MPVSKSAAEDSPQPGEVPGGSIDLAAAETHLRRVDPCLASIMNRTGSFRPDSHSEPNVFLSLMRAIVYQQLSGKAAGTIHRRLLTTLGDGATPDPAAVVAASTDTLRGAGLSANKERALRGLAEAFLDGTVPSDETLGNYSDTELIAAYSTLRGIGRWTVEMLLLFHLQRPDVLPIHDLGVRKGFARTYGWRKLPTPTQLTEYCEPWRPHRSVGSWYMWRATELPELDTTR